MSDDSVVCRSCGAWFSRDNAVCPFCGTAQMPMSGPGDGIPRRFGTSIAICFKKYARFAGRAPRAEFWYFALFTALVSIAIDAALYATGLPGQGVVAGLFNLVVFLPGIAVAVRRLHDIDRSGWWWWIILIPLVGGIVLIVWQCRRGTPGDNRFGPRNGLP